MRTKVGIFTNLIIFNSVSHSRDMEEKLNESCQSDCLLFSHHVHTGLYFTCYQISVESIRGKGPLIISGRHILLHCQHYALFWLHSVESLSRHRVGWNLSKLHSCMKSKRYFLPISLVMYAQQCQIWSPLWVPNLLPQMNSCPQWWPMCVKSVM